MFSWNYHKGIFIGSSGCGKTSEIVNNYLPLGNRLMIIDANMEIATKTGLPKTTKLKEWSPQIPCYYPREYSVKHLDESIKQLRKFNNVLFFLDDLDAHTGGNYFCGKELITLMVNGRHQNIGVLVANKTPTGIDKRIIQQCHYASIWNVSSRYFEAFSNWNDSLNYNGNIEDFMKLDTHTFGYFTPLQQDINATDPKKFSGFFESKKF